MVCKREKPLVKDEEKARDMAEEAEEAEEDKEEVEEMVKVTEWCLMELM